MPFNLGLYCHLNVMFTIIVIRMLHLSGKQKNGHSSFRSKRETRKDVKRATLHDKAYKRADGYMVDFINLQPQEKIVTTTRDVGRKREPQRQSVRGRGNKGKSWHAECSGRLYSEARQEVGVRWNSAKVEADQRWKSPIMITSFRL